MVPDVEEVRGEPQALALAKLEVLDQREIPVLLEGSTIDVPAQVAPRCEASVGIESAARGICEWRGRKVGWIQIAVVDAVVDAPAGQAVADGWAGELRASRAALQAAANEGRARRAVQDRERRAGLEDADAADRPIG